jgi:hypothetical protein
MNKKLLLMVLRVLSLTKGTTGAEDFQDLQEPFAPLPSTIEFVVSASSNNDVAFAR